MSRDNTTRQELLRALEAANRKSALDGLFYFQALAEQSGLNLTDLQCVALLTSTGPVTAGQLAGMMRLTTGAVTGVVNRLEQAGYARREPDPGDGRRVIIRPVDEVLKRVGAGLLGSAEGRLDALLTGHSHRDLVLLLDFMQRANALTEAEIAQLHAAPASVEKGHHAAPLGGLKSGRLIVNGPSRLTLHAAAEMNDLYQARFEGKAPKIEVTDGTVTFRRPRHLLPFDVGNHAADVALNPAVPWDIEVRGGAVRVEGNLKGLMLSSFTLKGGVVDVTLLLPEPSGVVPVRLSDGLSRATVHRPAGVEARLGVQGGVATLKFDDQRFESVGGVQLQSPGYPTATNRYDVSFAGGALEITVR